MMTATVYWNINKRLFSVRVGTRVVAHATDVYLANATFHVQPAGRERVRRTGRKNVHAYVKGTLCGPYRLTDPKPARYNPKRDETFTCEGEPLHCAGSVIFRALHGEAHVFIGNKRAHV